MSPSMGGEYSMAAGAGAALSTRRIQLPETGCLAPTSSPTSAETTTTPSVRTSTSRRTGQSWRVHTTQINCRRRRRTCSSAWAHPGRCTRDWCPSQVIPSATLPSATTRCSSATSRTSASGYGAPVVRTSGIAPTVCVPPGTLRRRDSTGASAPEKRWSNLTRTCSRRAGTPIAAQSW
jgi:hypothetical protein